MNDLIKIYSVHEDYSTIRRGHMHFAIQYIGSSNLGWFQEDQYNTNSINFYDANKFSLKEIKEIYQPFYIMGDDDDSDWKHDYAAEHGWGDVMIFDLDQFEIAGILEKVDLNKRCLEITYHDSQVIPDYKGEFQDIGDYMEEDDASIWTQGEPLIQAIRAAELPEFMWADVAPQFFPYCNGDRKDGIVKDIQTIVQTHNNVI